MHVFFIVATPFDRLSGGDVYDRRMIEGLRAAGHVVDVVALERSFPLTDAVAHDAARTAWASTASAPDAPVIIDGLALPAFLPMQDQLESRRVIGLVHHPTALETGHSDDDRQKLREAERSLIPRLHDIIVTSAPTADRLVADFGADRSRVSVVVPGTLEAPRSTGSQDGVCRILSVGTLIPRKGHDVLLQALARLFDLEWSLTIAGSPKRDHVHARTLSALAEGLGIANRVRFAGEADDGALNALWRDADMFALATHWEGYGVAIAEALKRGLPLALTSGGAAATLVTPEAAVVCPPGDHSGLSKALRRLIFSPSLRHEMADAAWAIGATLPSWTAQAGAFEAVLARSEMA
jgi:glycosyltransferase involved in cell wall biosynthesis